MGFLSTDTERKEEKYSGTSGNEQIAPRTGFSNEF